MDTFEAGPCARCRNVCVVPCQCGGRVDPVYRFILSGRTLSVVVPGDPVRWQVECPSIAVAKRRAPDIVRGFQQRKPPRDAVHRGRVDQEMVKGEEDEQYAGLRVVVRLAALMEAT